MGWSGQDESGCGTAKPAAPIVNSQAGTILGRALLHRSSLPSINLGTAGWEGCRGLASPEAPSAIEDGKRPRRSSSKVARPRLRMSAYQHQRRALRIRPSQGQPTGTAHGLSVQVRVILYLLGGWLIVMTWDQRRCVAPSAPVRPRPTGQRHSGGGAHCSARTALQRDCRQATPRHAMPPMDATRRAHVVARREVIGLRRSSSAVVRRPTTSTNQPAGESTDPSPDARPQAG